MTINKLLEEGKNKLKSKSKTYQLDCEILLSFVLGKDKVYLITHGDEKVKKDDIEHFERLIEMRSKGAPIAYLTNMKEFYSLSFYVDENGLIPRPETEGLVDLAFLEVKKKISEENKLRKIVICDVGTGSGCIGISLIYKILEENFNKNIKFIIFLTDVSEKALKIARRNFKSLIKKCENIKVKFIKTDLLKGIRNDCDIIVSNPPYIPSNKIELLDPTVRKFEPRIALDGGEKGLKKIKNLINQAIDKLSNDSVLLLEIYEEHPILIKFYLKQNFTDWDVEFKKDCFGEWRFAVIRGY